jgi:glucosamine--fructose-6-phosphate aminotransferase (isomerizing)
MDQQYNEIAEIPERATNFWTQSPSYVLPLHVPYLGMGSSYFAPLAFKLMGVDIQPEIASEYFNYPVEGIRSNHAVILSQSGKSSEALWCSHLFKSYTAISNYPDSPLCNSPLTSRQVMLMAGDEKYSSSNTYTNTLLALFKGFNLDAGVAVELLATKMRSYEVMGEQMAKQVFELISIQSIHGIYILGSGPNIATALQASLILSETTKRNFTGLVMAQYDHGPKETALNSIVINILAPGKSYTRGKALNQKMQKAGAHIITVENLDVEERFSVLHNIVPFNFMAYYLARYLNITDTFLVGGKVTEVE